MPKSLKRPEQKGPVPYSFQGQASSSRNRPDGKQQSWDYNRSQYRRPFNNPRFRHNFLNWEDKLDRDTKGMHDLVDLPVAWPSAAFSPKVTTDVSGCMNP